MVQATWIVGMAMFRAGDGGEARQTIINLASAVSRLPRVGLDHPDTAGMILAGWWFTLPVWLLHLRAFAERWVGMPGRYEQSLYAGAMLYAVLTLYATARPFVYFQF